MYITDPQATKPSKHPGETKEGAIFPQLKVVKFCMSIGMQM